MLYFKYPSISLYLVYSFFNFLVYIFNVICCRKNKDFNNYHHHIYPRFKKSNIQEIPIPHFDKKEELKTWYLSQLTLFSRLFADDKVYQANHQLNYTKKTLEWHISNRPSFIQTANHLLKELNNNEIVKKILGEVNTIDQLLVNLESSANWQYIGVRENVDRWYRAETNNSHTFKVSGIVDSPLFSILAVLNQVHMYHKWFPMMSSSILLNKPSRLRKFGISSINLPWPIAPRDMISYLYINELFDQQMIVIIVRSCNQNDPFFYSAPPPPEGTVRAECHYGGFSLQSISENKVFVKGVINIDPKMDFVPGWLISFLTGQMIHKSIVSIRKVSKIHLPENRDFLNHMKEFPQEYEDIKEMSSNITSI